MKPSIQQHLLSLNDDEPSHMVTLTLESPDKINDVVKWNHTICNEYTTHTNHVANIIKRTSGLRNQNIKMLVTRETHDKYENIKPVHYHGLLFLTEDQTIIFDSKTPIVKQLLCNKFKNDFPNCQTDIRKLVNSDRAISYVLKDVNNHIECVFLS